MSKRMGGFLAGRPAASRLDMVRDASGWKWRNSDDRVHEVVRHTNAYMLVVQPQDTVGLRRTVQERLTSGNRKKGSDLPASCSSNTSLENGYPKSRHLNRCLLEDDGAIGLGFEEEKCRWENTTPGV